MSGKKVEKKLDIWSFGIIGVTRMETIADGVLAIAMTIANNRNVI